MRRVRKGRWAHKGLRARKAQHLQFPDPKELRGQPARRAHKVRKVPLVLRVLLARKVLWDHKDLPARRV